MDKLKIGQGVQFVDQHGVERDAIITAVWDGRSEYWTDGEPRMGGEGGHPLTDPMHATINLVIVSGNENEHDNYGRQTKHETSVPHQRNTTSPGYYWF